MKKHVLAALMALFAAVPGIAVNHTLTFDMVCESPEMDLPTGQAPLVHDILKAAAEESTFSFQELWDGYHAGVVTIAKVPNGYRVVDGGGHAIVVIEELL